MLKLYKFRLDEFYISIQKFHQSKCFREVVSTLIEWFLTPAMKMSPGTDGRICKSFFYLNGPWVF